MRPSGYGDLQVFQKVGLRKFLSNCRKRLSGFWQSWSRVKNNGAKST